LRWYILGGVIGNKSKFTIELYPLYLIILFLSLIIIMYQIGNYALFPVQNAYSTTTYHETTKSAGQQVNINASKTSSSAGSPIEFTWRQTSGSSVLGDNNTLKGPVLSFKAPVEPYPQILKFQLTASKGPVTKSAEVNVLVKGDQPPKAEVRNYNIINAQDICSENTNTNNSPPTQKQITLDASNSTDAEGGPLKFKWTQTGGPPVTISNPDSMIATVENDSVCSGIKQTSYLEFRLDVIDSVGQSRSDNVTIPVKVNQLPIARISAPNEARSGQNITLDARASTDAEGPITGYNWSYKVNGGSFGDHNIPKSPTLYYTVPNTSVNSTLHLLLSVKDNEGAYSKLAEKIIDVMPDYRPIANSGTDRFIDNGELCVGDSETEFLFGIPTQLRKITLDASNSTDAEGGPLSFKWTQTGGPAGQITNENNVRASFSYDFCSITQNTNFNIRLDVVDDAGQMASDELTLTVGGL
jgi:large repetitive protein